MKFQTYKDQMYLAKTSKEIPFFFYLGFFSSHSKKVLLSYINVVLEQIDPLKKKS